MGTARCSHFSVPQVLALFHVAPYDRRHCHPAMVSLAHGWEGAVTDALCRCHDEGGSIVASRGARRRRSERWQHNASVEQMPTSSSSSTVWRATPKYPRQLARLTRLECESSALTGWGGTRSDPSGPRAAGTSTALSSKGGVLGILISITVGARGREQGRLGRWARPVGAMVDHEGDG